MGSGDLLAPRDSRFFVNAQAVFLPIPRESEVELTAVRFDHPPAPGVVGEADLDFIA